MKIGLLIVDIFLNKFKELREIELFYDGVKKFEYILEEIIVVFIMVNNCKLEKCVINLMMCKLFNW